MPKLCLLANAASSHTEKWARELSRRGWQVSIVSFLPAEIPGVEIYVVPKLLGGKFDVIFRAGWVVDKLRALAPDIVHAHYATSFGFLGTLAGLRPLIISAWGSDIFAFPRISPVHAWLLKRILRRADVLCSTSRIMAAEMRKYIGQDRPVEVIPFGVDVGTFRPGGPSARDSGQPVVFGVAKYLQPVYGLDILLQAFALLDRKNRGTARLRIAGTGDELVKLQALAAKLGIQDKIDWLGHLPNREVAAFYRTLDVVVVPSRQESFGVTAVEGSACGRPIIASEVGGLREVVINGETGILLPPEDPVKLAETMAYLIDHPAERQRLGQSGREFVLQHYDWAENVSLMEAVYRRVLESRSEVRGPKSE